MSAAASAANRILDRERWARERLAPFAGRVVEAACGPSRTRLRIEPTGHVVATSDPVDVSLRLSPLNAGSFLAEPARFSELVEVSGEAELGATIGELATALPWIVEDVMVRVAGPFAGPAIARMGKRALELPGFIAGKLSGNAARYVTEEAVPSIKQATLRAFAADVASLVERIDALEARVSRIATHAHD